MYRREAGLKTFIPKPVLSRHDVSSFDAFIRDITSDLKEDPHLEPYAPQIIEGTKIIRWDFDHLAKLLFLDEIPPYNVGYRMPDSPPEWTPELDALFQELYKDDIALWNA